jgi:hypothetical protein
MKGTLQVFKAVASAMIGVGKKKNLAKDFEATEKNGPWPYIVVGIIMTVLLLAQYLRQLGLPYLSVSIIWSSASAIGFGS